MKAILISTQPKWVELILNGIKKDEVRKGTTLYKAINKLIAKQGVAPMLIYCTKRSPWIYWNEGVAKINNGRGCVRGYKSLRNDNGKVVARFNATAEEIYNDSDEYYECYYQTNTLDMGDLLTQSCLYYSELDAYLYGEKGTDIHINDLEIFDKPKELNEFRVLAKGNKLDHSIDAINIMGGIPLTRAPQSWCYVEVSL